MSTRLPLADITFIRDFAAFCRTKGDGEYNPYDAGLCALAQFGHPAVQEHLLGPVPAPAFRAVFEATDGARNTPEGLPYRRFSALADCLDALLVDAPVVERVS